MLHFFKRPMPPDGNCQFHSILFIFNQIYPTKKLSIPFLRRIVAMNIKKNLTDLNFIRGALMDAPIPQSDNNSTFKHQAIEYYLKDQTYGDDFTLSVLSSVLKIGFIVVGVVNRKYQLLGNTIKPSSKHVAILQLTQSMSKSSGHYDVLGLKYNGNIVWYLDKRQIHNLVYINYLLKHLV